MTTRVGRPRASSRAMLEEAACELFLERGFAATSVADITSRAGVSRATFFNYVQTKSDLLWTRFDDAVVRLRIALAADPAPLLHDALTRFARDLPPENVALAFSQAEAMGLDEELRSASARRLVDLRDVIAGHVRRGGADALVAEARAAAHAGAMLAAVRAWSIAGAGRAPLEGYLETATAASGVRG